MPRERRMTMRSRLVPLVLAGLMLSVEVEAAADWVFYSEGPSLSFDPSGKPTRYYYDKNSLRRIEPGVFEIYHRTAIDDSVAAYSVSQYWIDCNTMQMAVGEWATYTQGKKLHGGNEFRSGWYAPPDYDRGAKLIRIICRSP